MTRFAFGASMSGCAVPEQRGTLSPVGSSQSAIERWELLSDELDLSPDFGHVTQDHVDPRIQPRAEGVVSPLGNSNIVTLAYKPP